MSETTTATTNDETSPTSKRRTWEERAAREDARAEEHLATYKRDVDTHAAYVASHERDVQNLIKHRAAVEDHFAFMRTHIERQTAAMERIADTLDAALTLKR